MYYSDGDDIAKPIHSKTGDNFHVYTGLRHRMEALEDTELFEFSTQHFDSDSYRIKRRLMESYKGKLSFKRRYCKPF